MGIREKIKGNNEITPNFENDELVRYHVVISGKFSVATANEKYGELIKQLEITGWIKSIDKKNSEMHIQGMNNKVEYFLEKIRRNKWVEIVEKESIPVSTIEQTFMIL